MAPPSMHGGSEMPPGGGRYLLSWRYVTGVLAAHLRFVVGVNYPRLAFAAVWGRSLKVLATLCGAPVVTPLYRCFVDPTYRRTNVLYDRLSPFLRRWFVRLAGPYHVDSVAALVAWERRGAVLLEFLFVLAQVALFFAPGALVAVTVLGVLLNAVPRQFYAQLKVMVRGLHITYMDTTAERLLGLVPREARPALRYDGRRVYDDEGVDNPKGYLAFRGNHHSGCWAVIRTEAIDFSFSFLGGMLMLYLLAFTVLVGLDLVGAADRDGRAGDYFPFAWVTAARFAKSACNFITTENLLSSIEARQSQHELYFLQRAAAVREQFPEPEKLAGAAAAAEARGCPRERLAFVGRPCLRGRAAPPAAPFSEAAPSLAVFNFLERRARTAAQFQATLDDSVWADRRSGKSVDEKALTRRPDGGFPTPFNSEDELNALRAYLLRALWSVFNVDEHRACPPDDETAAAHALVDCHNPAHDHARGDGSVAGRQTSRAALLGLGGDSPRSESRVPVEV